MRRFALTLSAIVLLVASAAAAPDARAAVPANTSGASGPAATPTVLITGANRGIGLEFARQYTQRGWKVIATARDPAQASELQALAAQHPKLVIEKLDVTDDAAIRALARKYQGQPIDVLLNNAGYLGEPDKQALGKSLDYPTFEQIMRVNSYAPVLISQAFLDNVAASDQKKIIAMTSGIGSITVASRFGGLMFYRMSKAALDLGMRAIQADVRAKGIKVGIVVPGEVETQMLRDSGYGGHGKPPAEAAAALIKVIDGLNDQDAKMIALTGETVPW
jgi:NAD(P)-dependent dehydrogenase (short-subunit alcohol dehydrogenase family)